MLWAHAPGHCRTKCMTTGGFTRKAIPKMGKSGKIHASDRLRGDVAGGDTDESATIRPSRKMSGRMTSRWETRKHAPLLRQQPRLVALDVPPTSARCIVHHKLRWDLWFNVMQKGRWRGLVRFLERHHDTKAKAPCSRGTKRAWAPAPFFNLDAQVLSSGLK